MPSSSEARPGSAGSSPSASPPVESRSCSPGGTPAAAAQVAGEIGEGARGLALDLAQPAELASKLEDLDRVGLARDHGDRAGREHRAELRHRRCPAARDAQARRLHGGDPRPGDTSGQRCGNRALRGLAKERPYPGSTTVTMVNGAVSSMVRTLALELAPVRVNAIHPGVVGDSPAWSGKPAEVLDALSAARRAAGWRRWRMSPTRRSSCSTTSPSTASTWTSTAAGSDLGGRREAG